MQVLVATMYQDDLLLPRKMNIKGKAVVVNQTSFKDCKDLQSKDNTLLFISTEERGLSRSRNMALANSDSPICLIADDDVVYVENYEQIIAGAYNDYPNADVILFDYFLDGKKRSSRLSRRAGRLNVLEALKGNSVRISFKRNEIVGKGISFNENFGSGSGVFIASEDLVFLVDCFKRKLNVYYVPIPILDLKTSESTWFNGYNREYFETLGAFSFHWLKKVWFLFPVQFIVRHIRICKEVGLLSAFRFMRDGMLKYKEIINKSNHLK